MNNTKKKDDELPILILVSGIFTAALLYVDMAYSDYNLLFTGIYTFIGSMVILMHLAIIAAWFIVLKNWQDPNFDGARKWLLMLVIITMVVVAGSKVISNEDRMMHEDIEKAKQEQAP